MVYRWGSVGGMGGVGGDYCGGGRVRVGGGKWDGVEKRRGWGIEDRG